MTGTIFGPRTQRFDLEIACGTLDALTTLPSHRVRLPHDPTARTIDEVDDHGGTT